MRWTLPLVLISTAVVMLFSSATQAQESVTVSIGDFYFDSAALTVEPGTTVTWTNVGQAPHNVTSTDGGPLASGTLQNGGTYSYTFEEPGSYAYFCSIHPNMVGSVTVTDGGGASDDASSQSYGDSDDGSMLPSTGGISLTVALAALLVGAGLLGRTLLRRRVP
ncbi:Copper binding protein, plastocyanin/azurin family [Rubrobacter radiotolerans]|uniref:Copper binding protein, plastocyanin/azurin family n=1 Tax=Rubrobacter radiotolerans TaxID=42256 RepID=A0A023X0U6_RUBRA|nr:cupredoxin family copper-binding protein [Rubrobacter radiotolerans]AHY46062.1 Copper binding protein, plastocyanin/azurin family [Rubrobacter radiotolerans]MDX5893472.1 cupredoxin family copper-binding protein [Rubrobacter radiotolerans]SMC03795.1 Plastocyanin [Rubrobacter radiotolerans DSM 5868]